MIQRTRSEERQRRTFKALSIKALIGQHIRKGQNLCMAVTSRIWKTAENKLGKVDSIPIKKNFPCCAKEFDIRGFRLGVTGSEWIPERIPCYHLPHSFPTFPLIITYSQL